MAMDAVRRTQWLATCVLGTTVLLLGGLLGRVAWLQKHPAPGMIEQLARQYTSKQEIPAPRGMIRTADGTPMAASVRMYNLFADPAYIMDDTGKLNGLKLGEEKQAMELLVEALAPLVKQPAEELKFTLEDNRYFKDEVSPGVYENGSRERRFLWLKKEVDDDFYKRFMELKSKMREESRDAAKLASKTRDPILRAKETEKARVLYHALEGVGFARSLERVYPLGHLGGSVLGFANRYEGVEGLERQLDNLLRGVPGSMYVTRDAARHTLLIQNQRYTAPDAGRDVWLTVNSVIQGIAEDELQKAVTEFRGQSGTAIVMDPHTGKILALANYPFIDPSDFATAPADIRRNRAVTDPYEPGSIFKPFVLAWALDKKIVKPTDVFDCRAGYYTDPTGRVVRDVEANGVATVTEILVRSSNIGMTQIGWKMGIPTLYEGITKFGFGQRTGVELPGDQKGLVAPLNKWTKGTLTSASFGYAVAATPLQLVRAFCTFANGGYLVTPRILDSVEEYPGKTVRWSEVAGSAPEQQIISAHTCDEMRDIMEGVYGPHGTAKTAASKIYRLYGKTGTAHIAGKARGDNAAGYGAHEYNASFLTGGPMTAPKVVCIVTIHKPDPSMGHFGGTVAAPAATAIVERTLLYEQVPGDKPAAPAAADRSTRRR
jgi:cell division protein FtsI/penicillin-binding protein 2